MYWLLIPLFISGIAGFVYIIYTIINNERKIQYNKRNALLLKQNTETVISIAKSRGYFVIMDRAMRNVFGHDDRYMIYHGTSTVVDNFKADKMFAYLVKYFNMNISFDTIRYLRQLEICTENLYMDVVDEGLNTDILTRLYPTFTMTYDSPGGRVHRTSCVYFDHAMVHDVRLYVENAMSKSNFTKRQRSKMTPALREYIKKRDHYTCQICGDNIHKNPDLILEVDHIIPVSKGGETVEYNLQALCRTCNRKKSNKL